MRPPSLQTDKDDADAGPGILGLQGDVKWSLCNVEGQVDAVLLGWWPAGFTSGRMKQPPDRGLALVACPVRQARLTQLDFQRHTEPPHEFSEKNKDP